MRYKIQAYSIWETGTRKSADGSPKQEDCIFPPHGALNSDDRLFIVCDGMGGAGDGEIASSTVCSAMSRSILSATSDGGFSKAALQDALVEAYEALDRRDNNAEVKMGTTMAMLKLFDAGYMTAHIGDSRVYHIRPGETWHDTRIIFQTEDHSMVNHLMKIGQMTAEEAKTSPKRKIITRAMQPNMEHRCKADVYQSVDIQPGDYFMLCTDGMVENMSDSNIRSIFSEEGGNDKNKIGLLNKVTANNADNHSAIIVHVIDVIDDSASVGGHDAYHADVSDDKQKEKATRSMDTKKRFNETTKRVSGKAKEIIHMHHDDGEISTWLVKLVFGVMGALALIMVVYYMFIRSNETLQTAGTALDQTVQTDIYQPEEETYGYEITEQDKKNQAEDIIPEPESEEVDDTEYTETDLAGKTTEATSSPNTDNAPAHIEDEPILQE